MGTVTKRTETYNVQVSDTKGNHIIPLSANRIDRAELLCVENPNYREMIRRYRHLKGVDMEDTDTKSLLPVHVILGASDYAKIKTSTSQRTGAIGEPVAEFTLLGWTIMSPGSEQNLDSMFLAQTTSSSYETLCRMDVLGLEDKPNGDQSVVYEEFIEQLSRSPEGWYETGLPWKGDHPPLPSNKSGSLKRLGSLVRRLEKTGKLDAYDAIIQEQLQEGVIEEAEMAASEREFYIPHKAVVRGSAESTKMRIVYDASARAYDSAPSLNDCLEVGPPLQNQLWEVLLRGRFHAVALAGDIRKAFLQVRIREQDRDALRFHWLDDKNPLRVHTYRFTRALFGLGPSPFHLGGVIHQHLNTCRADFPDAVAEIERELYVDDLITGGGTVQETEQKKATLHGGVGLTMAKIREEYWIPRLRRLAKKVIKQCHGCKRFQAVALAAPPPGLLPPERTEGSSPFEVVGVDFAGPIKYRKSSRAEGKAYLALYACSLPRSLTKSRNHYLHGKPKAIEMLLWLLPCVSTMLLKKENFKT